MCHLVVPTIVIGLGGTAADHPTHAGEPPRRAREPISRHGEARRPAADLYPPEYSFRMWLNPSITDIGNLLPHLVSGSVLVFLVISLPTVGPILLAAMKSQDQFLAGFILLFVAALTVAGMRISDLLLAWLDPRMQ
jgi:peptide/nickel transport system permease protein